MGITAVDVFCGAGGLTRGLLDAGIEVKAGYDIDEACQYPYEHNNAVKFHLTDVRKLKSTQLRASLGRGSPTLIAGCAPCQPFSLLGQTASDAPDGRQHLLAEFARLVYGTAPTYVTMENVPGLRKREVFNRFLATLEKRGYDYDYRVVDAQFFDVPQRRRRLVLLASRVGTIKVPQPKPGAPPTVRDAIRGLPAIDAGVSDTKDPAHRAARLSQMNLRRIRASVPDGTWEDWPAELRLVCHLKETGQQYIHPYGRMAWNRPAPTITTKFHNLGSGRFGHPSQDRAITPREAALLQTFPADYEFAAPGNELRVTTLGPLIGNAVPVNLGRHIGVALLDHWQTLRPAAR